MAVPGIMMEPPGTCPVRDGSRHLIERMIRCVRIDRALQLNEADHACRIHLRDEQAIALVAGPHEVVPVEKVEGEGTIST